jgi:hypothetical protein
MRDRIEYPVRRRKDLPAGTESSMIEMRRLEQWQKEKSKSGKKAAKAADTV